jgi:hypothetical protein
MFNNTYSPVGSPLKKNVNENTSPISSPIKHPRNDLAGSYKPAYTNAAQVLG